MWVFWDQILRYLRPLLPLWQLDINIKPHLSSEYITYLDNPLELIKEGERAAENDMWSLIQFTEQLRQQYGKEPHSMEVVIFIKNLVLNKLHDSFWNWVLPFFYMQLLLKKLYVRRMAADLGISKIYTGGKTVIMDTKMSKKVFKLMTESMTSDIYRNCLNFTGNEIKVCLWYYFCSMKQSHPGMIIILLISLFSLYDINDSIYVLQNLGLTDVKDNFEPISK